MRKFGLHQLLGILAVGTANTLLRTQKNQIFEEIRKASLDPSQFIWKLGRFSIFSGEQLVVEGVGFCCFGFDGDRRAIRFSPSRDSNHPTEVSSISWDQQLAHAKNWIKSVALEVLTPDLWQEWRKPSEHSRQIASESSENSVFTPAERQQIGRDLKELKNYIEKSAQLTADQNTHITRQIEYLQESSERLGRKDWINLAMGVITGWFVSSTLPANAAHEILTTVSTLFGWITQNAPPLLM